MTPSRAASRVFDELAWAAAIIKRCPDPYLGMLKNARRLDVVRDAREAYGYRHLSDDEDAPSAGDQERADRIWRWPNLLDDTTQTIVRARAVGCAWKVIQAKDARGRPKARSLPTLRKDFARGLEDIAAALAAGRIR